MSPQAINSKSILQRAARIPRTIPPLKIVENMSEMPQTEYRKYCDTFVMKKLSDEYDSSKWERVRGSQWSCLGWISSTCDRMYLTSEGKNHKYFWDNKKLMSWCISVSHLCSDTAVQNTTVMVILTIIATKIVAMEAWFFGEIVTMWTLNVKRIKIKW